MSIKISLLANDATSDPVKSLDLIIMSNEDGGGGFDVSKKITVAELLAFLGSIGAIAQDIVVTGTGTGAGPSEFKIGEIDGDGVYMGVDGFFTENNYMGYQSKTSGSVFHNAVATMNFTINNGQNQIRLMPNIVELVSGNASMILEVGNNITNSLGSKMYLKGETTDSSKHAVQVVDENNDDIFKIRNDGFIFLKNGTSVNNISTDGTAAANSDNNLMTEKAIVTLISGGTQIIGGVTLSSSSNTNILNGTYVILADTTTVTSVASGIGQDSNWTLEITQAGITNQKGVVAFTGNLEKGAGGGVNYDVAIFKNGSIISESEQIDQKLESGGKGQSVTVSAIVEFSTNDTFDIRVAGNGTADDIFCGGGSLYIQ